MDINQIAKMIEWLDEERRRDKATIVTLEERLAQQQEFIDVLQRRLNGVESDQTVMRGQVVTTTREQDMLDLVRKEMRQMLESGEARRLTAEREAERRHELARESLTRSVRELTDKFERFERLAADLADIKSERDRTKTTLTALQQRQDDLGKKLETPDRRLSQLEEARRQDTKRMSELESLLPELKKSIDTLRPKVELIEDLSLRNERRIQEVLNGDLQRREQIQQFVDQQTLLMQQRDQQIDELLRKFEEQDKIMQRNMERFETWSETYRSMKRIIDDFERIADRLERRINEVAEMQRLSEERFRQEWNDWRDDDQKRWKQFTISNDDVWRSHDREFDNFLKRTGEIEAALQPILDNIRRLWSLERDRAQLYRERYQALLLEYDTGETPSISLQPDSQADNGRTTE